MALGSILDEAKAVITGGRQDDYGKPEDSFVLIANFWSAYLTSLLCEDVCDEIQISPPDVARMMALLKIARMVCGQDKRDNYVDLAGYADIAGDFSFLAPTKATHATDKAGAETSRAAHSTDKAIGIDSAWDKAHERVRA